MSGEDIYRRAVIEENIDETAQWIENETGADSDFVSAVVRIFLSSCENNVTVRSLVERERERRQNSESSGRMAG